MTTTPDQMSNQLYWKLNFAFTNLFLVSQEWVAFLWSVFFFVASQVPKLWLLLVPLRSLIIAWKTDYYVNNGLPRITVPFIRSDNYYSDPYDLVDNPKFSDWNQFAPLYKIATTSSQRLTTILQIECIETPCWLPDRVIIFRISIIFIDLDFSLLLHKFQSHAFSFSVSTFIILCMKVRLLH